MAEMMKKERGDAFKSGSCAKDMEPSSSRVSVRVSESTQSCIRFERSVYKTLMNLNNEMSSALCGGVKDINGVCFKIMECLHDMERQERMYQRLRRSSSYDIPPLPAKPKASNTTMTSQTSLCDSKMLQVECVSPRRTQSVETEEAHISDEVVQCSFQCDVPEELAEASSMQQAFKQCLEAFIKDVEEVCFLFSYKRSPF